VGRRSLGRAHAKLDEIVVELDALGSVAERIQADEAYVALGTTMKKAGSKEAFRRVDHDLVLAAARACEARGVPRLALVSALGADPRSLIFYNRVKGEADESLKALRFTALHIARPSVLGGDRSEHRTGEAVGVAILRGVGPALVGPLAKYRLIDGAVVARALIRAMREDQPGVHVYDSDRLAALGA
jgi:uncharacterized protein YbjT (DUF2867 family)